MGPLSKYNSSLLYVNTLSDIFNFTFNRPKMYSVTDLQLLCENGYT